MPPTPRATTSVARQVRRLSTNAVHQPSPPHQSIPTHSGASMPSHPPVSSQAPPAAKKEGDISSVFMSLSAGSEPPPPLPQRFRDIKASLVAGHEKEVVASWTRLLEVLRRENEEVARRGSAIVPVVNYPDLEEELARDDVRDEVRKRGVLVVKGVVGEREARSWKGEVEAYVKRNPQTKAFPPHDPQVYELYWSAPQLLARSHPNLLRTQSLLMNNVWHTRTSSSPPDVATSGISSALPLSYADRLRIRQPGDAAFALGPHMDGGSVERWEPQGYGLGNVYAPIFSGSWEAYDPYDAVARVPIQTDLYSGAGNCSMFRMFQGWLSMSVCGPKMGTLLVNPLLEAATAYVLLRPFFRPVRAREEVGGRGERFLDGENWVFTAGQDMDSSLPGAMPGCGLEVRDEWHPHLEVSRTMVHVPEVRPGDFVVWHCDTIHAVDKVHAGTQDSSVLYIPVCPVTDINAAYLARQRDAFRAGLPGPDFPGGKGESEHVGRPGEELIATHAGRMAMGLKPLDVLADDTPEGRAALERANALLGF